MLLRIHNKILIISIIHVCCFLNLKRLKRQLHCITLNGEEQSTQFSPNNDFLVFKQIQSKSKWIQMQ